MGPAAAVGESASPACETLDCRNPLTRMRSAPPDWPPPQTSPSPLFTRRPNDRLAASLEGLRCLPHPKPLPSHRQPKPCLPPNPKPRVLFRCRSANHGRENAASVPPPKRISGISSFTPRGPLLAEGAEAAPPPPVKRRMMGFVRPASASHQRHPPTFAHPRAQGRGKAAASLSLYGLLSLQPSNHRRILPLFCPPFLFLGV
jgi:hypothetical protein